MGRLSIISKHQFPFKGEPRSSANESSGKYVPAAIDGLTGFPALTVGPFTSVVAADIEKQYSKPTPGSGVPSSSASPRYVGPPPGNRCKYNS